MRYEDLTKEQKDIVQEEWVRVLDDYCPPVFEDGTRKCDLGMICDRCHYDRALQLQHKSLLKERGIVLED